MLTKIRRSQNNAHPVYLAIAAIGDELFPV
jgi:hypothetical protein